MSSFQRFWSVILFVVENGLLLLKERDVVEKSIVDAEAKFKKAKNGEYGVSHEQIKILHNNNDRSNKNDLHHMEGTIFMR